MASDLEFESLLLLIVYYGCLSLLACLGAHRVWLLAQRRHLRQRPAPPASHPDPPLLVQVPLYNEPGVGPRVAKACSLLEYTAGKLIVQVLDDSTDDTAQRIRMANPGGHPIHVEQRTERAGFKAGALNYGLKLDGSPFVAMFDADFVPRPGFLRQLMPVLLGDEKLAFVQARWDHLNRDESALTRAQAALLDGHFLGEHAARSCRGLILNFNGTAGIWRRSAIDAAGGWEGDTLTEDLDISYRAHLAGWRCRFLEDVAVPAELPATWNALRSQQARWSRGSMQCARKLLRPLWASRLPLPMRAEGTIPLLANLAWPLVLVLMILLYPVFLTRQEAGLANLIWLDLAMLVPATACFLFFYTRILQLAGRRLPLGLGEALLAMLLAIGLSVNNSKAVWLGLFGGPGEFVRTPKSGSAGKRKRFEGLPELILAAYLLGAAFMAAAQGVFSAIPFTIFFAAGLSWAGAGTIKEGFRSKRLPSRKE